MQHTDFLIIGGGIIGISLSMAIKKQYPDSSVTIIEKEADCGLHASGRNSGVLHAGFYYTADSLKAKFTVEGNKRLTQYCEQKGLKINKCGKLVVAQNEAELGGLQELLQRAHRNGVQLEEISAQQAKEIEPRVKTFQSALWSPTTSSVDPKQIVASLLADARDLKINIQTNTQYLSTSPDGVLTTLGKFNASYIINCAGLYADKIAHDFGFGKEYKIIPFKGLYLISNERDNKIKTNIYPVPDLQNPFLGVHFTVTVDGKVKIGPTAIPAFWREHYSGTQRFNLKEMLDIVVDEMKLFARNDFGFRKLALHEIAKYRHAHMAKLASSMATGVNANQYRTRGPAGIRAQLYNTQTHRLEMDFKFAGDKKSFHVLNAVSPAFTCAFPFCDYLTLKIGEFINGINAKI